MKNKRPIHGGDIIGFAESIGKPKEEVIDFSSNLNPLAPLKSLQKVYQSSFELITQYPDLHCRALHQTIAQHLNVNTNNILAGNGAIALIELVIRTIQPKNVLLIEPCFNEYRRLAELNGAKVHSIFLKEEHQFQFCLAEIISQLKNIDLVILGSPNNPTGTALTRQELVTLINAVKKQNSFLLIDEAFIDWHPQNSVVKEIQEHSSFVVIRSLTKFFALAGIRIGYAVASNVLIEKMQTLQETWSCNALAQKLGGVALKDITFQKKSRQWFYEESVRFITELNKIPSIKAFPTLANYILIKVEKENVNNFCDSMKRAGIYLRTTNDYNGLNKNYFRAAIRKKEENQFLIERIFFNLV